MALAPKNNDIRRDRCHGLLARRCGSFMEFMKQYDSCPKQEGWALSLIAMCAGQLVDDGLMTMPEAIQAGHDLIDGVNNMGDAYDQLMQRVKGD